MAALRRSELQRTAARIRELFDQVENLTSERDALRKRVAELERDRGVLVEALVAAGRRARVAEIDGAAAITQTDVRPGQVLQAGQIEFEWRPEWRDREAVALRLLVKLAGWLEDPDAGEIDDTVSRAFKVADAFLEQCAGAGGAT